MSALSRMGTALGLAAVSSVALGACGTPASTTGSGSGGDTIKVGYVGALSGTSAANGTSDLRGVELAVSQINAAGGIKGKKIKLISADDRADPATSATASQKLVQQDGVVAVLGGPNSGTSLANTPIVTGAGVVRIVTIAQADNLIDPSADGFDLTFRASENNSYDVNALASYFEQQRFSKICVLADNTAYGDGGLAAIRTIFKTRGLAIAKVARHDAGATDLTPQALQLKGAGCDSLYVYSLGPDAALFLKTMAQVGWKVPVVGGHGLAAQSFLGLAGSAADGVVIPGLLDPSRPEAQAYIKAFDAKYSDNQDPAFVYSPMAYDAMKMLAKGLESAGGAGGQKLAAALNKVTLDDAASGRTGSTMSWTSDKHEAVSDNFIVLYQVKNGKFEFLTDQIESGAVR